MPERLTGRAGDVPAAAREAFTSGMHAAAVTAAVLLAGAAAPVLRRIRVRQDAGQADQLSPSGV
ncbi:hypothetical protein [Streptomyces sp. AHA2]|uniref:hypothetical protein n=1 Tax=Streptomyces sp. AHA2 TaxID=3064526 RepID=UPI003FA7E286